jgi:hypothetical protein
MVHICNPSTQEVEKENQEFKASLDYIARLYLRKTLKKKKKEAGGEPHLPSKLEAKFKPHYHQKNQININKLKKNKRTVIPLEKMGTSMKSL